MNNAEKIEKIRKLLDQPNCDGVELKLFDEEDGNLLFVANGYNTNLNDDTLYFFDVTCNINFDLEWVEILSYHPIPIELEPLKVGDRVWAKGDLGAIMETPQSNFSDDYEYEVRLDNGAYTFGERHELIEVQGE